MSDEKRPASFTISIPVTDDLIGTPFGDFRRYCVERTETECAAFCGVSRESLKIIRGEMQAEYDFDVTHDRSKVWEEDYLMNHVACTIWLEW